MDWILIRVVPVVGDMEQVTHKRLFQLHESPTVVLSRELNVMGQVKDPTRVCPVRSLFGAFDKKASSGGISRTIAGADCAGSQVE